MCNEKVIRDDLSEIKYYYSRQKELDGYMSEGLPSNVLNIVQRYANLIQKAPIRLYHVYVGLYVKGWTQENVALEMNYTLNYVQSLSGQLLQFFRETINKEEGVC